MEDGTYGQMMLYAVVGGVLGLITSPFTIGIALEMGFEFDGPDGATVTMGAVGGLLGWLYWMWKYRDDA